MAGTGKNLIFASRSSADSSQKNPHVEEAVASVAIKPGRLAVITAGDFALAGAGLAANALVYFADANFIKQQTVEDDNAVGDTMQAFLPRVGEKFNARLIAAQALVKGTPLKTAANGQLAIGNPATEEILFYSDEVVGATTADQLVRVLKA